MTTSKENELMNVPKDLKRITWLAEEYGFTYDEIYKAAKKNHEITIYESGALKISLKDFLEWVKRGMQPARGII